MKSFEYTITDPVGIHIRTITPLVKKIKEYPGHEFTITKDDNTVSLLRSSAVLRMAVKQGDVVTVNVSGNNEEAAAAAGEAFFKENL